MTQAKAMDLPGSSGPSKQWGPLRAPGHGKTRVTGRHGKRALKGVGAWRFPFWTGPQNQLPYYGWGYLAGTSYNSSVGRIYFSTIGGALDNSCTGTVVAPDIVVTAAHCIRARNGTYYSNWIFVPKQYAKTVPYGAWTARRATTYDYYYTVGDPRVAKLGFGPMDYGFLVMNPINGYHLGNYVGYYNMLINSPGSPVFHEGYPATGPWIPYCPFPNASKSDITCYVWYCYAPIGKYGSDYAGWYEVGIGCNTGGGSSGGPWFEQYNGHWYVASVESTGLSGTIVNQWGPYFNDWTLSLFNYAKTL